MIPTPSSPPSQNGVVKLELSKRVALVAGSGSFPLEFAKKVRQLGSELVVVGFEGETDPSLSELCEQIHWLKVGQLSKLLSVLQKSKVNDVAFAGGISRVKLFRNAWPDMRALALAAKLGTIKDDVLLRAVAQEVEHLGMRVVNGATFLDRAVPGFGRFGARDLTSDEKADALIGWRAAKALGALDVGQSVVVYKSLVVAVEAVEGTDQTLKRSGALTQLSESRKRESGAVLVKTCKPQQDKRLDLPTIGPQTIREMKANGVTALVVEAEASLILDAHLVAELVDEFGIAFFVARNEHDLEEATQIARDFTLQSQ